MPMHVVNGGMGTVTRRHWTYAACACWREASLLAGTGAPASPPPLLQLGWGLGLGLSLSLAACMGRVGRLMKCSCFGGRHVS